MEVNDIIQIDYEAGKNKVEACQEKVYVCNCYSRYNKAKFYITEVDKEGICIKCGYYATLELKSKALHYDPVKDVVKTAKSNKIYDSTIRDKWDAILLKDYEKFGPFIDKVADYHNTSKKTIRGRLDRCSPSVKSLFYKDNQIKYILVHGYRKFGNDIDKLIKHYDICQKTFYNYLKKYDLYNCFNKEKNPQKNPEILQTIKSKVYH